MHWMIKYHHNLEITREHSYHTCQIIPSMNPGMHSNCCVPGRWAVKESPQVEPRIDFSC